MSPPAPCVGRMQTLSPPPIPSSPSRWGASQVVPKQALAHRAGRRLRLPAPRAGRTTPSPRHPRCAQLQKPCTTALNLATRRRPSAPGHFAEGCGTDQARLARALPGQAERVSPPSSLHSLPFSTLLLLSPLSSLLPPLAPPYSSYFSPRPPSSPPSYSLLLLQVLFSSSLLFFVASSPGPSPYPPSPVMPACAHPSTQSAVAGSPHLAWPPAGCRCGPYPTWRSPRWS